jgi:hypothetical protein
MSDTGEVAMDYERSQAIGALAAALAKAQGAIEAAKKGSENPHFKSKYADLASVMAVARGPLSVNGLAVVQAVTTEGQRAVITTELMHASGEWMRSTMRLPVGRQDAQGYGSAFTYGRRYGYMAMVGIAPDEDDDGNAASAGQAQRQPPASSSKTSQLKAKLQAQEEPQPEGPRVDAEDAAIVPFGKNAGKPLSSLTDKQVLWYLERARDNPNDAAWLAQLEGEMDRRTEASTQNGAHP